MFFFPLSNLCPHCGKELIYYNSKFIGCFVKGLYLDWYNINFLAYFHNNRISTIYSRIDNYTIVNELDNNSTSIIEINRCIRRVNKLFYINNHISQQQLAKDKLNKLLLLL